MSDDTRPDKPDVRDELDKELDELAKHVPEHEPKVDAGGGSLLRIVGGFVVIGLFAVGSVFAWQKLHEQPAPEVATWIGAKLDLAAGEVLLSSGRVGEVG
jgi:hypothetical protein